MIKKILKLEGAQQLSKKEQNTIHGGDGLCLSFCDDLGCPEGQACMYLPCNGDGADWFCVAPKGGGINKL